MKHKISDRYYNGVRENKILKAEPVLNEENMAHLYTFITERYKIHIRKDVKKTNPPYTHNTILNDFRFTNVRREHDRESLWLINNIAQNDFLSYRNKVMNIILFRLFNKSSTLELIGAPLDFRDYNPEIYRKILTNKSIDDPKYVFFTSAFITGGMKRALKWYLPGGEDSMTMRVMRFMEYLNKDKVFQKIKACESQKEVFELMRSYMGIGDFLAYQIFVDFTYIDKFKFSENEFSVAGPGCKRGIDYMFDDRDGMTYDEALFWLRDNIDEMFMGLEANDKINGTWNPRALFKDLPEEDRYMNVMSLENCMCEISKYIRAVDGTGRPRNRYRRG